MNNIWSFHQVHYKRNRYLSFPCITSSQGDLFLVFREADEDSHRRAMDGTPIHHANQSRILFSTSKDQGHSWSTPIEIFKGKYGVNDPGITALKSGKLVVRVTEIEVKISQERAKLEGRFLSHRGEFGEVSAVYGNSYIISEDLGKTWSIPMKMDFGALNYSVSREPIVELSDGTLVLSVYESTPFRSEECYLIRSWDGGLGWSDAALIAKDPAAINSLYASNNYNEASIVELSPNHLIALIRCDESYYTNDQMDYIPVGGIGEVRIAFSHNNGLSWSIPKRSGIFGQPISCIQVKKGVLLAVYAKRKNPYQLAYRVSETSGQTWNNEIIIKDGVCHWDFGYPSLTVNQGQVVLAFYWQKADGTRFIEVASATLSGVLRK